MIFFRKVSSLLLIFYGASFFLAPRYDFFVYPKVIFGVAIIFLTGVNCIIILSSLLKRKFSLAEYIVLSTAAALTILPAIIFFENKIFGFFGTKIPIINIFLIFILAVYFAYKNTGLFTKIGISFENIKAEIRPSTTLIFSMIIAFLAVLVFAYPHLPDLDPYGWIIRSKDAFVQKSFGPGLSRSSFYAFNFIHQNILGTELFYIFKYLYPFYALLILAPLCLVACQLKNRMHRYLFLASIFISPTVTVGFAMTMPQLFWIILFFYFICFLIYSENEGKEIFFSMAGAIALLGSLYHIGFILFFAVWAFLAILKFRKYFSKEKIFYFLALALVFFYLGIGKDFIGFFVKFIPKIWRSIWINHQFNWSFPSTYQNIDGNSVGWGSGIGIVKYYGFYAGPLVIFTLGIFVFLVMLNSDFRSFLAKKIKTFSGFAIISIFLLLFTLSEVLPRLANIALLPDRVWVFEGIVMIAGIYWILEFFEYQKYSRKKIMAFISLFIFSLAISLAGSFYINYLKKYLITPEQMRSAGWIKNNLPSDRIIISSGQRNLLVYHAHSNIIQVDKSFYKNAGAEDGTLVRIGEKNRYQDEYAKYQKITTNLLNKNAELLTIDSKNLKEIDAIKKNLESIIAYSQNILPPEAKLLGLKDDSENSRSYYIYYAPPSPKNPYVKRPYATSAWGFKQAGGFIFDQYPEKFERVYDRDEVIIWKIK